MSLGTRPGCLYQNEMERIEIQAAAHFENLQEKIREKERNRFNRSRD